MDLKELEATAAQELANWEATCAGRGAVHLRVRRPKTGVWRCRCPHCCEIAWREELRWCRVASREQISNRVCPLRSVNSSRIRRRVGSANALKTSPMGRMIGK